MKNDMTYNEIAEQIFEAIDIIVDKKLEALEFDRCIVAEVLAAKREKNTYYCKYQDKQFWAAPSAPHASYSIGDYVYVLIPQNNFNRYDKIIVGIKGASKN